MSDARRTLADAVRVPPGYDLASRLGGPVDPESTLERAEVLIGHPRSDERRLSDSFRRAWRAEVAELRDEDAQRYRLSDALQVPANEISFENDEGWLATVSGARIGWWQSRPAFVADLASERVLDARLDGWKDRPVEERRHLLVAVRSFLDECPACDGDVAAEEDVRRLGDGEEIVAITRACIDCRAVLFQGTRP